MTANEREALFEATGVGTYLLTGWKENLSDYFGPDREAVAFNNLPEWADKLQYLLSHPAKRAEIAKAGQR